MTNYEKLIVIVVGVLVLFLTLNVFISEWRVARIEAKNYTVDPFLMEAYEWLNKNTPKDSVILALALESNVDIPVYTHNRIFLARAANTIAGEEEILERYFLSRSLFGFSPEFVSKELATHRWVFYLFIEKYSPRALDTHLRPERYDVFTLPSYILDQILHKYTTFVVPEKLPYRLDYIFIGPREIALNPKLVQKTKVYDKNGVTIYKM